MVLKTDRLILRKHQLEDFDRFWEMLNDPIAKQYTGGVTELNFEQRLTVFKKDCMKPFTDVQAEFAIIREIDEEYLGYCGIMPAQDTGVVEFFYGLCRDSWGKGYGYEAANAALKYFFMHEKNEQYIATVNSKNRRSIKLLNKLGFRKTGHIEDTNHDVINCYMITRKNLARESGI